MSFSINIMFGGNCREAVTFYSTVFGQETPQFITYGEGDASFDPNVKVSAKGLDLVMSTSLDIAGTTVSFLDMPDQFEFIRGNSVGIVLTYENDEEAKMIFERLSEGGQVFVPFGPIPDQGCFGMLGDKFDLSWTIRSL